MFARLPFTYTPYSVTATLSVEAFQLTLICVEEITVAVKPVGTVGGVTSPDTPYACLSSAATSTVGSMAPDRNEFLVKYPINTPLRQICGTLVLAANVLHAEFEPNDPPYVPKLLNMLSVEKELP